MTEPLGQHQRERFLSGRVGVQGDRVLGHPLPDLMGCRVVLRGKRPHDVPFREDADQVLTVDHECCADMLEAHHLSGLGDGRRGRDRDEIDAHELADGRHDRS